MWKVHLFGDSFHKNHSQYASARELFADVGTTQLQCRHLDGWETHHTLQITLQNILKHIINGLICSRIHFYSVKYEKEVIEKVN